MYKGLVKVSQWDLDRIFNELLNRSNDSYLEPLQKMGININLAYGVPLPEIQRLAKSIGPNHFMGFSLWETKILEPRLLAIMLMDPFLLSKEEAEDLLQNCEYDYVCDQLCQFLLRFSPEAKDWSLEWIQKKKKFEKRAGYTIIAQICAQPMVWDKKTYQHVAQTISESLKGESRESVLIQAVLALKAIGKSSYDLQAMVLACCEKMIASGDRGTIWVASEIKKVYHG